MVIYPYELTLYGYFFYDTILVLLQLYAVLAYSSNDINWRSILSKRKNVEKEDFKGTRDLAIHRTRELNTKLLKEVIEEVAKAREDYATWDEKAKQARVTLTMCIERRDELAVDIHNKLQTLSTVENAIEAYSKCETLAINK